SRAADARGATGTHGSALSRGPRTGDRGDTSAGGRSIRGGPSPPPRTPALRRSARRARRRVSSEARSLTVLDGSVTNSRPGADTVPLGRRVPDDVSSGRLRGGEPLGVYVHFPFCGVRCPYCDFAVDTRAEIPHDIYADVAV